MAKENDPVVFDNLINFRDITTLTNATDGTENRLMSGRIFRSARPDFISSTDKAKLRDQVGIAVIVDLRSKTEHIESAKKFSKLNATSTAKNRAEEAPKISSIKYVEINLNGKGFERHLVWQLSYINLARLVGYMAFGYRLEGISVMSRNVLQPRGLIGLGKDTLKHSGPEIKQVFDLLAREDSYPILLHCTQGKDRTGLIVVLVLLLCEVELDAITRDYMRSEQELAPEFEERMVEIKSIGLDESFARCPAEFVFEVASFIKDEYGGIREYLNSIGIPNDKVDLVRQHLLVQER